MVITFEKLEPGHFEKVLRWRLENQDAFYGKPFSTIEQYEKWYNDSGKNEHNFIIMVDDVPIGTISLLNISNNTAEIGRFMIGEDSYRRKGIGGESVRLLVQMAHDKFGVDRLRCVIKPDNIAVLKMHEKNGAKVKEIIVEYNYSENGI